MGLFSNIDNYVGPNYRVGRNISKTLINLQVKCCLIFDNLVNNLHCELKKVQSSSRTVKQNFKNLIFFAAVAQSTPQGCRSRWDQPPTVIITSTRGADYANHITTCPPEFLLPKARPVVPGCAGCAMVHPYFGRSVNPISTRGDRLCPHNYYWHTRIFRPSDGPD